ncbi:D-alanine--D-alanine ligase family protein [Nocardioides mesophilus]|uniref:D-alanine--D-alanine ligase n=1 Tax=Nocardioides mesophilus TaxID=433659 RepID=A0A7G9R917_9ACTN|nr:D-alanine--D-alanine ligase family protein [Nocardioides mesophilus]QNN52092.1 D-alanine--D-alanine ligase [Nocardioides mesophilus]
MDFRKPRVAVVFGGRSSEHSVSCVTAGSVLQALDPERYDVVPVGITKDGRWVLESPDPARLTFTSADCLPEVDGSRAGVALASAAHSSELVVSEPGGSAPRTLGEVDVVFPVLHGPWGEDGTVQGLLEMAGVRYVGAGVLASAVGMDKAFMKVAFQAQGLPVLPYTVITSRAWATDRAACLEAVDSLGYPVFVKPCRGGSSLGISKVRDRSDLEAAVEEARRHDPKVLVETAAEGGREIECGVLQGFGTNPPDTSVVAEIRIDAKHEFYDFAAKYLPGEQTSLDVPADLPEQVVTRVQALSAQAFEALGCEGLARVDFFLLADDRLVINEINTMPGFTPSSMFPRMWAATGLDYPALVDRLVQLALHRDTGLR